MFNLPLLIAHTVLTVFAAASLHAAFPELGKRFEAEHPGVIVRFDFNGSQILEAQLALGAQADVFASADARWMKSAVSDGIAEAPFQFARNSLVVVTNPSSGVTRLADLTRPGLRLILCIEAAPCGRYARATLENMNSCAGFGNKFSTAVLRNLVSEETDVEAVLAKVNLGEADAGIVYRSDAVSLRNNRLRVIELPAADQPAIVYPIAVLRASTSRRLAEEFITFVRLGEGRKILQHFGFTPVQQPAK